MNAFCELTKSTPPIGATRPDSGVTTFHVTPASVVRKMDVRVLIHPIFGVSMRNLNLLRSNRNRARCGFSNHVLPLPISPQLSHGGPRFSAIPSLP